MTKNFLDILVLRMIQEEPTWGYKIIKRIQNMFNVKIRHGSLYPLLNSLENMNYLTSSKITKNSRVRKVYKITSKGVKLVDAYYEFLKEHLERIDLKEDY